LKGLPVGIASSDDDMQVTTAACFASQGKYVENASAGPLRSVVEVCRTSGVLTLNPVANHTTADSDAQDAVAWSCSNLAIRAKFLQDVRTLS
jgi:hypothetical protein